MNIGVLGCGAYALALTHILVENKNNVTIWTHSENKVKDLIKSRVSDRLKEYKIPLKVEITSDLKKTIENKDLIVVAIPAFAFEETIKKIKPYISKKTKVAIATKGIQQETCLFLNEIFYKYLKNPYAIISGPTFAKDMINSVPIGLTLATKNRSTDKLIRKCFENDKTKFRTSKDIIGVEICGSVKNVMAIASGMLEGMNVSDSTRALFLTESMNDIKELIHALGGRKKTILSFAGFGDILLTCTSKSSRNFTYGYLIGSNVSQKEIDEYLANNTVEGLYTLKSIHQLVRRKKVKMPIINLIHNIIVGKKDKEEIYKFLIKK